MYSSSIKQILKLNIAVGYLYINYTRFFVVVAFLLLFLGRACACRSFQTRNQTCAQATT